MDKLNFHVSGEFITNFARDMYMESGHIQDGVSVLHTAFPTMPEDIILSIIKGNQKLVGVDDVCLEPDNKTIRPYYFIRPINIAIIDYGWIAPNGDVYGEKGEYTMTQLHENIASEIVNSKLVPYNEASNYSSVESAGWVKFCCKEIIAYTRPNKITEMQRQRVVEYMTSQDLQTINVGFQETLSKATIETMDLLAFGKVLTNY